MPKKIIKPILLSMLMLLCVCSKSFAYQLSDDNEKLLGSPYYIDYQYAHSDYLVTKENKVWTITLNNKVSINKDTYNYIYVIDKKNNRVPIVLKTSNNGKSDNKILVYPKKNYTFEEKYILVVDKGLKGEKGEITKSKSIKKFQIVPKALLGCPTGMDVLQSTHEGIKECLKNYYVSLNLSNDFVTWLPIKFKLEDVDKIPLYCINPKINFYVSKDGIYYVRGLIDGFDPKEPDFNFSFKINISDD